MINIRKEIAIISGLIAIAVFIISGCAKDRTVYIPLKTEEIVTPILFSADILPILTKNCALSGCHAKGAHAPDMSADDAYNSLIKGSFVDTTNAENSIIYKRLTGKLTPAMPMGAATNPSNINALMLAWIKQGAKKN